MVMSSAAASERECAAVDLHMHTTCSDGKLSPKELVEKAAAVGLRTISITDHDNLAAYQEAKPVADALGVELIPGVEVSTSHLGRDVHILGYFVQDNSELSEYLKACRERRILRTEKIVHNLRKLGVYIHIEKVFEKAANGSVGRPHIAAVLQETGYVQSYNEAFAKYIGTNSPAYEKSVETDPADVIRLINEAGGLSFLAHPGRFVPDETIRFLIDAGLDGIEIIHPAHDAEQQEFYRAIANEYFLLMSGGSDYHGTKPQDEENFGQLVMQYKWLEKMRNCLVHI
ncbi:MAG: PHP domain-containing protein [Candidatus Thermochlorobacter sp.]